MKNIPITVLGAGAWGTALTLLLARNGNSVRLWTHDPAQAAMMRTQRANPEFLPGFDLPESLTIESDLALSLDGVQDILIAVPSAVFTDVLHKIKSCRLPSLRIAWGTKGLDAASGRLLSEMVSEIFGEDAPAAALGGPSFAHELAKGLPTAVSLSGNNREFLSDLITRLHGDNFRVYENADFPGVQLCGVVKNILAIAVGMADGLQFGANTRCALITRGLAEMSRLNTALGGKSSTLMSLAGVGDLVLTCTDNQSRNRRFGLAIGGGRSPEEAEKEIGKVIEGLKNTQQVRAIAHRLNLEMPITEQVYNILYQNHKPREVVTSLLKRQLKVE